jgi:nitrogen fixation protein
MHTRFARLSIHLLLAIGIMLGLAFIAEVPTSSAAEITNIARSARATASTVFSNDYRPERAIDGIWGYNQWVWASAGELNPWLRLSWSSTQVVTEVRIYDRPGTDENINSGVLTFSDGSSLVVRDIPQEGTSPKRVSFAPKAITWVKFQVTGGEGANLGVSEIEVYGRAEQSSPTTTTVATTATTVTPTSTPPIEHTSGATNYARSARATASTVFSNDYRPERAIDGIWGYNQWVWASAGELNPWLQLDWSSTQVVTAVRIYDRPGTGENINSGVLTFSDGSSITVENIPQDGALPKELHFEAKDITWVKFQVTGGEGANLGVSEFEVYGTSSQTTPTTTATTTTVPTITPLPDELGCTISINSGAVHTNSPNVQLYLQVPEATQMQISNDGGFSGTRWQTYQVTTSWMLNDPGARIATLLVYARFRDAKGNVLCGGASLIDDIIYDPLPPTVTLRLTPLAAKQSRLQLQVDDQVGGSGVDAMMLANRSDFLGAVWQPFTDTIILNETQGNTIFVRVRDRAGSSSAITSLPDAKRSAVYLPLMHR